MKRRFLLVGCGCLATAVMLLTGRPALAIDAGRSLYVEGYSGRVSYAPGDEAEFHISTPSAKYDLEIARMGAKREVVFAKQGVSGGQEYGVPEKASSAGCGWPVAYRMKIPVDWRSGYYEVRMRVADGGGQFTQRNSRSAEGTFYFVLRAAQPGKGSKILLQLSTNTYNAYNNWGGSSLYGFHGRGGLQGHQVSFQRPPRSLFSRWELPFVVWAENNGYELEYCSNQDLQFRPELIDAYQLMLSVGHDEYWSWEMRDTVEDFVAGGGNVAFFSGNTCCWQVRWEEASRSLLCWKQWYNQDPAFTAVKPEEKQRLSSLWSHHLVGRTENEMTGVGFIHGGYHKSHGQHMDGPGAFTVHRPEHWIFAGTNLKVGDAFGGKDTIVGYECDGCELEWKDGLPFPTFRDGTPKTFEVLGTCEATWAPGDSIWYDQWPSLDHSGHAVLGSYTTQQGGTVVTSGTTDWAHGLAGGDATVIQITKNVLDRLAK